MIKVKAETHDTRDEIIQIANIFRATIIDVSRETLTLAIFGDETKAGALMNLLADFGILELVRTGILAIERGPAPSTTTPRSRTSSTRARTCCRAPLENLCADCIIAYHSFSPQLWPIHRWTKRLHA